jgi:alcohol dehydrogenase
MKAIVYGGPGIKTLQDVPIPQVSSPTDAIIKLTGTTICGTDLHIIKGDVPETGPGSILGHEGIGIVHEVGAGVSKFQKGDKVLISCITACNECAYCKKGLQAHCIEGGWQLGHTINGTQAEYVRIPHADYSLYEIGSLEGKVADSSLLMLSDILPTGNEIGALNGRIQEGDVVAIVGGGSVGISALVAAKTFKPSLTIVVDFNEERLRIAKEVFGADIGLNPGKVDVVKEIQTITTGHNVGVRSQLHPGVDVAIEAVGIPQTFNTCQKIIAPGGRIANVGVHGVKVDLELQDLWIKNINISTGLVNANSTPDLLKKIVDGVLDPSALVTHKFKFTEALEAYEVFANAEKEKCIKVYLEF